MIISFGSSFKRFDSLQLGLKSDFVSIALFVSSRLWQLECSLPFRKKESIFIV